ncbi:MAG: MOSC domain-containing protein [bacterium]|nr:MOSC domain-containing protein [bacterium]
MDKKGILVGVCRGERRASQKTKIAGGYLHVNHGLDGDAHAGTVKEISLAVMEDIMALNEREGIAAGPGDFAENLTTKGLKLAEMKVGARIRVGNKAEIEVIQIGKRPEEMTSGFNFQGHTLLPTQGVFCRVIRNGRVRIGDAVAWIAKEKGEREI